MSKTKKIGLVAVFVTVLISVTLSFASYRLYKRATSTPTNSTPQTALNILHFNDGYDVRKTPRFITRYLERKTKETMSIFSGDLLSPSIVSDFAKGDQFIPFLNIIEMQFAVPGNHEYDFGEKQFNHFIAQGKAKWMLANFKLKDKPTQSISNLSEHSIINISGYKIGVFGLVDTNWIKSTKLNSSKYDYEPFDVAAARVSRLLKDQGCEVIFVISHMSTESDGKVLNGQNSIDVVFGGHDHIYLVKRANGKLLIKSGSDFEYFSQVKLFFSGSIPSSEYCNDTCKNYEFVLDEEFENQPQFFCFSLPRGPENFLNIVIEKVKINDNDKKNEQMSEFIRENLDPLINDHLVPLIRLESKVDAREMRLGNKESGIGNFFADLGRAYFGTHVGIIKAGIFKSEKIFPKHMLLRKIELNKIFPYKRDVYQVIEMTGQEIIEAIEEGLEKYPKYSPKFLSLSGVTFQITQKGAPFHRVIRKSFRINGRPLKPLFLYRVAIVSELRHEIYGLKAIIQKEVVSLQKDHLSPIEMFENFARLSSEEANLKEFEIFKSKFPSFDLEKLINIKPKTSNHQRNRLLYVANDKGNTNEGLEEFSEETLKRLRMYSLVSTLVEFDDHKIFGVTFKIDGRFKIDKKVMVY